MELDLCLDVAFVSVKSTRVWRCSAGNRKNLTLLLNRTVQFVTRYEKTDHLLKLFKTR